MENQSINDSQHNLDFEEFSFTDEHEAFAASRSSDFVYEPNSSHHYEELDKHAETVEMDSKPPLVVLGDPGSGKSALLANWVKRRRETKHREEFLFQHFVGCSTRSKQLGHMLFRLLSSIDEFFQLRLEVPKGEERLIWSLNRFLAQAAKKNTIARIIIVIDGVNMIKGKDNPEGALHWLPTILPPGVRFLISTVEYDTYETRGRGKEKYGSDVREHRTFCELKRRNCPFERIEPLSIDVMKKIIGAYMLRCPKLLLSETEQARISECHHATQPLYLRILLYALTLSLDMGYFLGEQMSIYLKCTSSTALTSKMLDFYSEQIDDSEATPMSPKKTKAARVGFLGSVLSVLYVSRHGLKDGEIWGAVELATQTDLPPVTRQKAHKLIKDFTMIVGGFRSFSHEEIKRVVFQKYIETPEANIRLHMLMARYFSHFPANDRKVDCLPYHLEVSGSWTKLKNCLVDIDMFNIFWTPTFKNEFIELWASLSNRVEPEAYFNKLVTGEFDETMKVNQPPRPCYDLVEEYAKSVEEYRDRMHPTDEETAKICLQIAEFLLEFATLGHEVRTDVPAFLHPPVPQQDFKSMGVPYLSQEDDGRSTLITPYLEKFQGPDDGKQAPDIMPKPNEDFPTVSTYFYERWMWIQFPLVALANCGKHFFIGMEYAQDKRRYFHKDDDVDNKEKSKGKKKGILIEEATTDLSQSLPTYMRDRSKKTLDTSRKARQSWTFTRLPELKNMMNKDARLKVKPKLDHLKPVERPVGNNEEADEMHGAFETALKQLREEINVMRSQYDTMVNHRPMLEKKYDELKEECSALVQLDSASAERERKKAKLENRELALDKKHNYERTVGQNYEKILLMCERHPAHSGALINELEQKLKLYDKLIVSIGDRFRADKYERQATIIEYRKLRSALDETTALRNEMLRERQKQHDNLMKANEFFVTETKLKHKRSILESEASSVHSIDEGDFENATVPSSVQRVPSSIPDGQEDSKGKNINFGKAIETLIQRTGVTNINVLIDKFQDSSLVEEIMKRRKAELEKKKDELLECLGKLEVELNVARFDTGTQAGSKEIRDKDSDYNKALHKLKQEQEKAEAAESLQRQLLSGIKHISKLLGIELSGEETTQTLIYNIEMVIDAISDEKDKNLQKGETGTLSPKQSQVSMNNSSSMSLARASLFEISAKAATSEMVRPREVEAALQQFEAPKARIASRLAARTAADELEKVKYTMSLISVSDPAVEDEEKVDGDEDPGTVMDRKMVKIKSTRTLNTEKRKARLKQDAAGV